MGHTQGVTQGRGVAETAKPIEECLAHRSRKEAERARESWWQRALKEVPVYSVHLSRNKVHWKTKFVSIKYLKTILTLIHVDI
jgi:hypothetical protein